MEQDMILYETPLLDELEEIIYVSDIRDYSLLYLNRAGRSLTGLKQEDVRNSKCQGYPMSLLHQCQTEQGRLLRVGI